MLQYVYTRGISAGKLAKLLTYAQGRGEYIVGEACLVHTDNAERYLNCRRKHLPADYHSQYSKHAAPHVNGFFM